MSVFHFASEHGTYEQLSFKRRAQSVTKVVYLDQWEAMALVCGGEDGLEVSSERRCWIGGRQDETRRTPMGDSAVKKWRR